MGIKKRKKKKESKRLCKHQYTDSKAYVVLQSKEKQNKINAKAT